MTIREMHAHETREVLRLMRLLWPDCEDETIEDEAVLVLERDGGGLGGFLALDLRPWAEGCTSEPCACVEGWWVDEDLRRHGWGRKLMEAAEAWARSRGLRELASDAAVVNAVSIRAHLELGFEEVSRVVCFRKLLV